jgi:KDO2-lipid IV(A) lauroyltransferase
VSATDAPRRAPVFRREERHEIRHLLSIWCAVALSWIFWLTPPFLRYWIADRISDFTECASTTYIENVRDNLVKASGDTLSEEELSAYVRTIFRSSARNFMDLITMARASAKSLRGSIEVTEGDWSMIENAIAKGRGVVFVTGHIGCFDFIGQLFRARGYKLTIVTGRTTSRFLFDGVTHLRASRGNSMVEPTPSGVRNVIRALRRGECAVFLSDRDFFQNGRNVTFFGHETTLPPGAIRIARDTGAVVVPIFTRRRRRGHELRIFEPFTVASTKDVDADVDAGLQILVKHLERGISGGLDQWVMFQRVWPAEPPPPVRVFPVGTPLESELLEKVAAALPERHPDGGTGRAAPYGRIG